MTQKARYKKSESVLVLESLADAKDREKHPNLPYHVKSKYRDDTANGLTKCVIDWIRFNGGQAERINTTGRPIDSRRIVTDVVGREKQIGSISWVHSTSTNGSADISATIHGKSVKIEVKIGRDRQSESQRKYQADIEAAGGIYIIVRDFDGFVKWWNEEGRLL